MDPPDPTEGLHPGLSREEVFRTLYMSVEYVIGAGVVGHLAEFGTGSGDTACVLAKALAVFGERLRHSESHHGIGRRDLHLFDSFQGLPKIENTVDAVSPHVAAGYWKRGSCKGVDLDALQRKISRHLPGDCVHIHSGWFAETLPALPAFGLTFALVHVDCDLYESARVVLDHLFEHAMIADGAMFLFDDWDCNRASPKFGERRAFTEAIERFELNVSDCGRYGFASRRFIVHH